MRKSLLKALVGLEIDDGRQRLTDTLAPVGIEHGKKDLECRA